MAVRVRAGGRLHVGFLNLSLTRERLYGGVGLALDRPATVVVAEPAGELDCPDGLFAAQARRSVDHLGVDGARVRAQRTLPRHVGLGSGTQGALAVHAAIARAHGLDPAVRAAAPALDRGGRSGVGVATFEEGGFVVDAGHPTERFTTERPPRGSWTVPPVAVRHDLPEDWRIVVVLPEAPPGRSGPVEEAAIREAVQDADPAIADRVASVVVDRLLPAAAAGELAAFGAAMGEVDRLTGVWFADEQGGIYRPPVGAIVEALGASPAVAGVGQSSWGPAVFGLTDAERATTAEAAAREALAEAGVDGETILARPRNAGATVDRVAASTHGEPAG